MSTSRTRYSWNVPWPSASRRTKIIVSGARGKHLDPTLKASQLPKGALPTTSKMGIDATIPDGVDRSEYELLEYPFLDDVELEDFV